MMRLPNKPGRERWDRSCAPRFDQSSHGHGKAAAIAFLLFTLAYTPCLATVAEMRRQFGTKVAARSVLLSLAVAYVIAIIAFQTLRLIW